VGSGRRATEDTRVLTAALLAEDALIFGLRMNDGVDLGPLKEQSPDAPWDQVEALVQRLREEGLAAIDATTVRLEPRGRLLADAIGSEIMAAFDRVAHPPASPALR
jgi:oxygen-independent coproporphyrinogen-3 oxidase